MKLAGELESCPSWRMCTHPHSAEHQVQLTKLTGKPKCLFGPLKCTAISTIMYAERDNLRTAHTESSPVSVQSNKCQSFHEVDAGQSTPVSQQSVTRSRNITQMYLSENVSGHNFKPSAWHPNYMAGTVVAVMIWHPSEPYEYDLWWQISQCGWKRRQGGGDKPANFAVLFLLFCIFQLTVLFLLQQF